jgi:hypothetical protein
MQDPVFHIFTGWERLEGHYIVKNSLKADLYTEAYKLTWDLVEKDHLNIIIRITSDKGKMDDHFKHE